MADKFNLKVDWALYPWGGTKDMERLWGNRTIGNEDDVMDWPNDLGKKLVFEVLEKLGKQPKKSEIVDIETEDCLYMIKTQSWTTPDSNDKIFGMAIKYIEIPEKYNKPLKIVCVAHQEYDLIKGSVRLFKNITAKHERFLEFVSENNIEYVKFSDLVEELKEDNK